MSTPNSGHWEQGTVVGFRGFGASGFSREEAARLNRGGALGECKFRVVTVVSQSCGQPILQIYLTPPH